MNQIDFQAGYRYASEILDDRAANPVEVLVFALPRWKPATAKNLIESANTRKAHGVNLSYQDGVIARAEQELQP